MGQYSYYADKLSADRLRRCYEIAPPRVVQFLEAELRHVLGKIRPGDTVLDLGCGFGRVLGDLAARAGLVVGIDNAWASLRAAREDLRGQSNCRLLQMNGAALGLGAWVFDVVVCIQNGISAFHVSRQDLVAESIRVTKPGGMVLFSTYSARFWDDRLEWFQLQSQHGLIGEIDWPATGDGVIVCRDGFTATTIAPSEFTSLAAPFEVDVTLEEVDGSSLFCEIRVHR
jgi:2-polyprenyl-6-hydroxyphenyl methylase/3-demethylubiquinone-9 3-methyltransferase